MWHNSQNPLTQTNRLLCTDFSFETLITIDPVPLSSTLSIPHSLSMAYVRSPILIGDNKRKYSSHQPWIHGTSLMWALHVWCCVTDFSSLTALLEYLVTCKIRAQLPPPDGRYQIICNFVRTCYEPRDYANLIFDRCVAARLCQQTRFIVPVESAGANRVPIVPEDSGSHRHRVRTLNTFINIKWVSMKYSPNALIKAIISQLFQSATVSITMYRNTCRNMPSHACISSEKFNMWGIDRW